MDGMTERIIVDGHRHVLVRADDLLWAVNTLKIENRYDSSEVVQRLDGALPHDEGAMDWNHPNYLDDRSEQLPAAVRSTLRAIRDEDYDALGIGNKREAIRLGQGEADYLIVDAMKLAARRALEEVGDFT